MCTFHEKGRMVQRMELQIQMTELRGIENYSQALKPCLLLFFFLIYLFNLFIYLAVLGLCCCARAFSNCSEQGLLFVVVCGLLIVVASLVAEHRL